MHETVRLYRTFLVAAQFPCRLSTRRKSNRLSSKRILLRRLRFLRQLGEAGAYDTPLEISMSVRYADQCGTHVRNEIIKEKFNLTFEYVPVNWSDWNEKIRTWIAMDDAPDILHMDLKGAQSNEFKSWAKQGAFSPFLEEYFASRPNLKKVYDESPTIPYLKVDGVLYGWPGLNSYRGYDDRVDDPYWTYRRDWAKAVGKYKENDIYTWEEWLDLIRTVMEEDPGNNGPGNTAGLVMPPWAFPHAPVLLIGPPATDGNESCSYFQQDGVYVWPPATEEYKTGVKITYDMYQEGLIYQDNILFTSSENVDMFVGGARLCRLRPLWLAEFLLPQHAGSRHHRRALRHWFRGGIGLRRQDVSHPGCGLLGRYLLPSRS